MSRIHDGILEELSINYYFPYDRLVEIVRAKAPRYAHLVDFLEEGSSNIKEEPKEESNLAKCIVL